MSTVVPGSGNESTTSIQPQQIAAANGQGNDVSSSLLAQTTANLSINHQLPGPPPIGVLPNATYPASTGLPYPPCYAYNPLAYAVAGTQLAAANPYAYSYPYPAYYQQAVATIPTPPSIIPSQPTTTNNEEDKKSKKNKKGKKQEAEAVEDEDEDDPTVDNSNKKTKANNVLPFWGKRMTNRFNRVICLKCSLFFVVHLYR